MSADGTTRPSAAPRLVRSRPLWGRIVGLESATPGIRIVRIEIVHGGPFRFTAGQYARVAFGEQRPRPFSMANRPDEPLLEFHLRHVPDGGAAAAMAAHLRRGEGVWVEGPYGDAWLRGEHPGPILAIAGGCGLAPAKAIVETALRARPDRDVWLYFGARDASEVYLARHFRALAASCPNFRYVPVLSAAADAADFRTGLITDAVAADFATLAGFKAYVFGPRPMVAAAITVLVERELPVADVHMDEAAAPAAAATQAEVFSVSGAGM